jgi:hypothetical protein
MKTALAPDVFHAVENPAEAGQAFSMAWKTPRKIFHGVENPDYSGGPPRPGQDGGEAEALAVRPDQSSSRMRR